MAYAFLLNRYLPIPSKQERKITFFEVLALFHIFLNAGDQWDKDEVDL